MARAHGFLGRARDKIESVFTQEKKKTKKRKNKKKKKKEEALDVNVMVRPSVRDIVRFPV